MEDEVGMNGLALRQFRGLHQSALIHRQEK
jgi:hypothetical protein